jgi:cytochrome c biogenesis protein CcmG/thiol:disulfide interchange protein DsbE
VRTALSYAACATAIAALAGCGNQPRNSSPSRSAISAALSHSPPQLARLHRQANELLTGGSHGFRERLASLRGYPVVVNMWASWCGPCQSEFPSYQRAAVSYGRRVAFLGIDAKDQTAAAAAFLRRFPVTYPSYVDPGGSIASALGAYTAYPQTFFFDRRGRKVYDKAGPYLSVGELERDIRQYALG